MGCSTAVVQTTVNRWVVGSNPTTPVGKVSEWLMEADCKSVGSAYGGSNPSLPTSKGD